MIVALLLGVPAVGALAAGAEAAPGNGGLAPAGQAVAASDAGYVVVGPGETIWDLVAPHVPAGQDRASYVDSVLAHNGLTATAVRPGTVVRLP